MTASMKIAIVSTLFLLWFQYLVECEDTNLLMGTIKIRHKRSVRQRAFKRACSVHTCQNLKCNNKDGWFLYGSDWGCCGNYDGCCTWASSVCYYHDALCKCCDYGWLICGPDCKKDAECFETYEEESNNIFDEHHAQDSEDRKDTVRSNQIKKLENKQNFHRKITSSKKQKNEIIRTEEKPQTYLVKQKTKGITAKNHKFGQPKYIKHGILHFKQKIGRPMYRMRNQQFLMADQPLIDFNDEGSGDIG
ncbi:unnamed protein product [Mytilus edulis]|uniref:Uncharacterized protein n=1 Tax=Mytilus edulis TaxID=6550 RepID=A0A8S3UGK0_MYTED|nr:unnamed protein product [Mytilus edulis]